MSRWLVAAITLSICICPIANAARDADMASRCAALCDTAIKKPYGWGWPDAASPPADTARKSPAPPPVIDLLPTARHGLILLLAGDLNDDAAAFRGAIEAARMLAAAQEPTGRIPLHAKLGPRALPITQWEQTPDRAATVAALALLLSIDARTTSASSARQNLSPEELESLQRSARRAALWLVRQQGHDGGWPDQLDDSKHPENTSRLMLLDRTGYRNCTVALLMAAIAFDDASLRHQANLSIQQLIDLRISPEAPAGVGLWHSACAFDGKPMLDPAASDRFDPTRALRLPDLLASKYSIQTLLAAYMLDDNRDALTIASHSADSIAELRNADGTWTRFTGAAMKAIPAPLAPPAALPVFGPAPPAASQMLVAAAAETLNLAPALAGVTSLRVTGVDDFEKSLPPPLALRERLMLTLAGLSDFPLDPALHIHSLALDDPAALAVLTQISQLGTVVNPNNH